MRATFAIRRSLATGHARRGARRMSAKVLLVAGARPNYMKIAPLWWAMRERGDERFTPVLVHTGQHYDDSMSDGLLPRPRPSRAATSTWAWDPGSHAAQTAQVMIGFEQVLAGGAARRGGGRRRRQLDGGVRAGDVEDRPRRATAGRCDPCWRTSRRGCAVVRPRHARGGEPHRRRRALRPAVHDLPRGAPTTWRARACRRSASASSATR